MGLKTVKSSVSSQSAGGPKPSKNKVNGKKQPSPTKSGEDTVEEFPKDSPLPGIGGSSLVSPLVAPMPAVVTSKNSSIFVGNFASESSKFSPLIQLSAPNFLPNTSELLKKFAINKELPEPLAIFYIKPSEVKFLLAATYQALFEDKCSLEFSRRMYQLLQEKNDKILPNIQASISTEIKAVENLLNGIESLSGIIDEFGDNLNNKQSELAKNLASEDLKSFKLDKLIIREPLSPSMIDVLNVMIPNGENEKRCITTQAMQILHFCADFFRTGCSPHLINGKVYSAPGQSKLMKKVKSSKQTSKAKNAASEVDVLNDTVRQSSLPVLSTIKIEVSENFVPQINSKNGSLLAYSHYYQRLKLSSFSKVKTLKASAYLAAMLANEFAISAGLGRLEGTELASRFGIGGNYVNNFFGIDSISSAVDETAAVGSLCDYLIVNQEDGSNSVSNNSEGVMLLEGSNFVNRKKRLNCQEGFAKNVLRKPTSKTNNKITSLQNAVINSEKAYEAGENLFKTLHLMDKDVSLLSPKGLYMRILKDFSVALQDFFDNTTDNTVASELCLLSLLARNSVGSEDQYDSNNFLKEIILRGMCLNAIKMLPGAANPSTEKYTPNNDQLRFSPDDSLLFYAIDSNSFNDLEGAIREAGASISSISIDPDFFQLKNMMSIVTRKDPSTSPDSFLFSILVKIYVDLSIEADKLSKSDKGSASFVDYARRTKNSNIDATIALAIILEIASSLSALFVNSSFYSNYGKTQSGNSYQVGGVTVTQVSPQIDAISAKNIKQLEFSQRALKTIVNAVEKDNFGSILIKDGDQELVPDLDNSPFSTVISSPSLSEQVKISDFRDIFENLSIERNLPSYAFASLKSRIDYTAKSSQKIVDAGRQLLGLDKQEDIYKTIADYSTTKSGESFLSSFDSFDIDVARMNLRNMKSSLESSAGRLPKLSTGEYNCIKSILPSLTFTGQSSLFVVTALPKSFINHSVDPKFSTKEDTESLKKSTLNLSISKDPVFTNEKFGDKTFRFLTKKYIDNYSFDVFENEEPQNGLDDIIQRIKLTNGQTGAQFILQNDQSSAVTLLKNECISFLLKKMFSVLSSVDLMEENITDTSFDARPTSAQQLAREFATAYGLPNSTFDSAFVDDKNKQSLLLDRNIMRSLSIDSFQDSTEKVIVKKSPLTFGESELFFDLFSCIHFLSGKISDMILTPSLFDRTLGVICNESTFKKLKTSSSSNLLGMSKVKNVTQQSLKMQSLLGNTNSLSFDTYKVLVTEGKKL